MRTTSVTLLERLRQPGDLEAWNRFANLYTPALLYWARQRGLQEADAVDMVQEVLVVACQQLPDFSYDPARRFRGWLRTIAVNKANEFDRRKSIQNRHFPADGADEAAAAKDESFWEHDYRQHLFARALQVMQAEFEPATWQAALESVNGGSSTPEIGRKFNMSAAAVYQARSRVLKRLRQELQGLWD